MADRDLVKAVALLHQLQPALATRDRARLAEIIGQLVALRAPVGEQWEQLAYLAASIGEFGLARKSADLLGAALGAGAASRYRKSALLFELGYLDEADALLASVPDGQLDPVALAYSRGMVAINLGRPEEARGHLEQVTRARPQLGSAWQLLSQTADLSGEPALSERIVAAERGMQSAPPAERAPYYYALGKVHADRGDHGGAFAAFARGAQTMKSVAPFDAAHDRAEAAEAVRGYSAERIAAVARTQAEPTDRTIFVIGLPRSGTSLMQQILTGHSEVCDGGELGFLSLLGGDVGGPSWPALDRFARGGGVAGAAGLWRHWLDGRFGPTGRIVNKAVDTSRFLGLAAALLPQAPLVWIERDPLDRAWSCFRTQFFGTSQAWTYDLADIAAHFRLEDQLLAQWRTLLGERLLVLSFEELVSEPAATIRKLLAHCGLADEPGPYAPHENRRSVKTASMAQVRRPINRDGIGTAAAYRAQMEPFVAAYFG
jgi:hypothetical protein